MKCARCYKELDCDISLCSLYCDDCMKVIRKKQKSKKACMKISKNLIDKCKNCKKDFSSCKAKKVYVSVIFTDMKKQYHQI